MRTQIGLWYCFERKESKLMFRELKERPDQLVSSAMLRQFFVKQEFFALK
jgi:hypothetical protein